MFGDTSIRVRLFRILEREEDKDRSHLTGIFQDQMVKEILFSSTFPGQNYHFPAQVYRIYR